ncbi:sensor histidine kinase [Mesobacillus zeae]|uniref:Sensor histidine kinase n=1 Tax=Mesobacillus zeae TaxID=1917180 RepID=A0A398AXZ7_9BACI|nr:sensor histidine kinase [Mesobacillus zeae]RID82445.1 sensor histidine kinase [Mesobacillus zeae]
MNTIQRQILGGILLSVLLFVFLTAAYFWEFPFKEWIDLWEQELFDIPFILFTASVSITIGILYGVFSGFFLHRQFQRIDQWLFKMEEGRHAETGQGAVLQEVTDISSRIDRLQKQITEKAKLSQRLATEKAEEQEVRIQKIVSQERNRLARELHDSVSQQLFAASMMMSAINEQNAESPVSDHEAKQLKMVEEMIHQSQLEMRALLLHLRPAALKGKSLQEGIEELMVELQQKVSMKISWKIEPFLLDKGVEDHLFRILQEGVSNTLRHSKATELGVLLVTRDDMVILRISDDGVGFEADEPKAGSYGLQNMHERAGEIGSTLKIVSVKNKGTKLEVKVPILHTAGDEND